MALDTFHRLNDFYRYIRGSFWPNLRVISTFFELLQMFEVKMRPQKRQKIDISNFKSSYYKTSWSYGQNCLGGYFKRKKEHLLAPFIFFLIYQKLENWVWKLVFFDQKIEVFRK